MEGRSCDSALSDTVNTIEKSISQGEYCLGVFLDIQGAFDNLQYDSISREMKERGAHLEQVEWYDHLLRNRELEVSIKGAKCKKQPTQGTPQGGVLSTDAWNITFQPLLDLFIKGPVKANGFADDTLLLLCGKDLKTLISIMQKAIDKAINWGNQEKLAFNPKKTAAIIFTRNHKLKINTLPKLKMSGVELEYVNSTRYLGVIIDSKLSWTEHINTKIIECKKILFSLRSAIGSKWGLTPERCWWVWETMVRPKLSYGSIVWAQAAQSKTNTMKLE